MSLTQIFHEIELLPEEERHTLFEMLKVLEEPTKVPSRLERIEAARKEAAAVYGEALHEAFGTDPHAGIKEMRREGYGH